MTSRPGDLESRLRGCALLALAGIALLAGCASSGNAGASTVDARGAAAWDLEDVRVEELPAGWSVARTGWHAEVREDAPSDPERASSRRAVRVVLPEGARQPHAHFGNLLTTLDAAPYRGHAVRLRARVRDEAPIEGDCARLWMRIDRPGHLGGFLGSTEDLPLATGEWAWREVTGAVAADATKIVIGFVVPGDGPAWIDDVSFEAVAPPPAGWPTLLDRVALHRLDNDDLHAFRHRSTLLSDFFGRDVEMLAGVAVPPGRERDPSLPIGYQVHGFGGDFTRAWTDGALALEAMRAGREPELLHVYLDANCPLGHHEFADSVNNGPWERALVEEFIPALEARFGGPRAPHQRLLTGHSSGGWSVLWLQLRRPEFFGGCWATSPDPVDFRDFSGVDLYASDNLYFDASGSPQYISERDGRPDRTFEAYTRDEIEARAGTHGLGGQMASFDAVFSPRGWDGRPEPMYDRASGVIDRGVVDAWRRYDIGALVREQWSDLRPRLAGKVRVWCGEIDDFRLDGALLFLDEDQRALGGGMEILIVPDRTHHSIYQPHPHHWPDGMLARIYREMAAAAYAAE